MNVCQRHGINPRRAMGEQAASNQWHQSGPRHTRTGTSDNRESICKGGGGQRAVSSSGVKGQGQAVAVAPETGLDRSWAFGRGYLHPWQPDGGGIGRRNASRSLSATCWCLLMSEPSGSQRPGNLHPNRDTWTCGLSTSLEPSTVWEEGEGRLCPCPPSCPAAAGACPS